MMLLSIIASPSEQNRLRVGYVFFDMDLEASYRIIPQQALLCQGALDQYLEALEPRSIL